MTNTTQRQLEPILKGLEKDNEFECIFNHQKTTPLSTLRFVRVLRKALFSDYKSTQEQTLDISYTVKDLDSVRLSIHGDEAIDSIVRTFSSSSSTSLVSILVGRVLKGGGDSRSVPPTPTVILKEKDKYHQQSYEDHEYEVRYRLSNETKPSKELLKSLLSSSNLNPRCITMRYKHRVSTYLFQDKTATVRLDMTSVRQSSNLTRLVRTPPKYEIELDISVQASPSSEAINAFFKAIPNILGWLQSSSPEEVVTKSLRTDIISAYKQLIQYDKFYQMKPISMDGDKFINILPNNYAVTDKADGDTAGFIIFKGRGYLLNANLQVASIGLDLSSKTDIDKVTIAEGELVHIEESNTTYLLLYDCLFFNNEDLRDVSLPQRLKALDALVSLIWGKGTQFPSKANSYGDYLASLGKNKFIITRKMYLFPKGVDKEEIYRLSNDMWNHMPNLPYQRDGLIFTGIDQRYTMIQKSVSLPILKWKPPELNSIDFYVEFLKKEDGSIDLLFDRTSGAIPADRPFVTLKLFVSRSKGGREYPVPFLEKEGKHQAIVYVSQDDPIPRDAEGHPIEDGTVLEMVYDMNTDGPFNRRWMVLRTRHDKTFNVRENQTRYGNNESVSMKIWDTIINPISIADFNGMASKTDQYSSGIRSRFIHTAQITSENDIQVDSYYQFQTEAGKPMRKFHNQVVKDILISTYFTPRKEVGTQTPKRQSILDIGCGRGGDIHKMANARVKEVVGIDPDENGLFVSSDCAKNRYKEALRKQPGFPPMYFIQADATVSLDPNEQEQRFPGMNTENKSMIKKHLGLKAKFSGINMAFCIHYMFTHSGMKGLIDNINRLLVPSGVLVITTFNAHRVKQFLGDSKEKSATYLDSEGQEHPFFTIRNISVEDKPGLEQAIDVFLSLYMNEGSFYTEYLVYPETLEALFKKQSSLNLIDHCSFEHLRVTTEAYGGERIFDMTNPIDVASIQLSNLYDVYVFQKK